MLRSMVVPLIAVMAICALAADKEAPRVLPSVALAGVSEDPLLATIATEDQFECQPDGRSMCLGATSDGQAFYSVGCRAGDQMVSIKPSEEFRP